MHVDITGIVAVGGFWAFGIAWAIKRPLMALIDKNKSNKNGEVAALNQRIAHLENILSNMHQDMIDLKEGHEFGKQLSDTKTAGTLPVSDAHKIHLSPEQSAVKPRD